jgi:hypothetical protein
MWEYKKVRITKYEDVIETLNNYGKEGWEAFQ